MDLSKVKELIELMNRHSLEEVEVEQDGIRVRLCKQGDRSKELVSFPSVFPGAGFPAAGPGAAQVPAAAAANAPVVETGNLITSPMVGTYYQSPNPDADAFVEVGDRIEEGAVICIIEAMKVMNEVKAETSGVLEAILVDNGQSIEFGQPLFRLS